jgi:hypothetical protein
MISKRKITIDILKETELVNTKPLETPTNLNVKLLPSQEETLLDRKDIEYLLENRIITLQLVQFQLVW